MFYNKIRRASQEFTMSNHYCPNKIIMNPTYYYNLEREMFGKQKWFLIKNAEVLGMKIVIDYNVKDFKLE